jgi:cytochrome c556
LRNLRSLLLALPLAVPLVVLVGVVLGDAPDPPAMSKVVPADDLVKEVDLLVTTCREGLVDEQVYMEKSRQITRDAHTLAVLALVLAKHDQDHRLKAAAPTVLTAAQQLAKAKDFMAAKQGFQAVEDAVNGEPPVAAADVKWERVAGLGQLMKQVTFMNNRVRRNIRRFEERSEDNARDAAALAAIAQVCVFDTHEVKDPAQLDKWYELCGEMRDTAGQLNAHIRAGNKPAAETALVNLGKSCEACHETFRVRTEP